MTLKNDANDWTVEVELNFHLNLSGFEAVMVFWEVLECSVHLQSCLLLQVLVYVTV